MGPLGRGCITAAAASPLSAALTQSDYRRTVGNHSGTDRARLAVRVRRYTFGVSCSQWQDAMRVRALLLARPSPPYPDLDLTLMRARPACTIGLRRESRRSALFACERRSACSSGTAMRSRSVVGLSK